VKSIAHLKVGADADSNRLKRRRKVYESKTMRIPKGTTRTSTFTSVVGEGKEIHAKKKAKRRVKRVLQTELEATLRRGHGSKKRV